MEPKRYKSKPSTNWQQALQDTASDPTNPNPGTIQFEELIHGPRWATHWDWEPVLSAELANKRSTRIKTKDEQIHTQKKLRMSTDATGARTDGREGHRRPTSLRYRLWEWRLSTYTSSSVSRSRLPPQADEDGVTERPRRRAPHRILAPPWDWRLAGGPGLPRHHPPRPLAAQLCWRKLMP
jgi:hypothetical protein